MLTSAEFAEEWAVYQLHPWADEWERTSLIASFLWNGFGGKPRVNPDHFMPGRERRQSPQEVQNRLNVFFGMQKRKQHG